MSTNDNQFGGDEKKKKTFSCRNCLFLGRRFRCWTGENNVKYTLWLFFDESTDYSQIFNVFLSVSQIFGKP